MDSARVPLRESFDVVLTSKASVESVSIDSGNEERST